MSACPLEPAAWLRAHLAAHLAGRRWPLACTFELTSRCNFRCVHCYLAPRRSTGAELSTAAVLRLLDELAAAGCLGLALTGGEPLCRPDAASLVAAAVERGFFVTLMTNGSLLTEAVADALAARPPRAVEVTLYGADAAGYQEITGAGAEFARVLAGVDRLLERGLQVVLKAMLLAPIAPTMERLRDLAGARGLELRLDPGIDPRLNGDGAPRRLRLPPEQAAAIEWADPTVRRRWIADRQQRRAAPPPPAARCEAGVHAGHLDATGQLSPCLMLRRPAFDAAALGFAAAWESLGRVEPPAFPSGSACIACAQQALCAWCPALAALDGPGDEDRTYHCDLAHERQAVLESVDDGDGAEGSG